MIGFILLILILPPLLLMSAVILVAVMAGFVNGVEYIRKTIMGE